MKCDKSLYCHYLCIQENKNITSAAIQLKLLTPVVIVKGTLSDPKEAYLTIEREILCKVPIKEIPMILLASFYVFDMKFTQGLTNVFMFLEHYFLGFKVPKEKTKVKNFISQLAHII